MAIGNGILEPYVHSNYYNFLGAGSVFNVFSEKYNDGRVYTDTIEELEKISKTINYQKEIVMEILKTEMESQKVAQ